MAFTDIWTINPMPAERAVIRGDSWRVTVLTDRLLRLDNPYHCPHGRPTMVVLSKRDMDRKFKRIV